MIAPMMCWAGWKRGCCQSHGTTHYKLSTSGGISRSWDFSGGAAKHNTNSYMIGRIGADASGNVYAFSVGEFISSFGPAYWSGSQASAAPSAFRWSNKADGRSILTVPPTIDRVVFSGTGGLVASTGATSWSMNFLTGVSIIPECCTAWIGGDLYFLYATGSGPTFSVQVRKLNGLTGATTWNTASSSTNDAPIGMGVASGVLWYLTRTFGTTHHTLWTVNLSTGAHTLASSATDASLSNANRFRMCSDGTFVVGLGNIGAGTHAIRKRPDFSTVCSMSTADAMGVVGLETDGINVFVAYQNTGTNVDARVEKYNASGAKQWQWTPPGHSPFSALKPHAVECIALGADGAIYAGGQFLDPRL